MRLRARAVPPPEPLRQLDFLPRTAKGCYLNPRTAKPDSLNPTTAQAKHQTSLRQAEKQNDNHLQPKADVFQPKQASAAKNTEPGPRVISAAAAPEIQASILSPAALSYVSNSSNAANNTTSIGAIPLTKTAVPTKKGLQGSRWAKSGDSDRAENANHFTGIIDIPH